MADRRRRWSLGAVLAVAIGLSGCAGVPSSGTVHLGSALPGVSGADDRTIHAYPYGPIDGQGPVQVVRQYLDAMVDNDNNFGVARRFLAGGTSWSPTARTVLYKEPSLTVHAVRPGVIEASYQQVGVVDGDGGYRVQAASGHARFRLAREAGQWRIAKLAPGVLLSTSDALRSLQPVNLYYFNVAQSRLVPAPILVSPDEPGLATLLIRALLNGPPDALAAAVTTAAPSGLDLVGNVPIDGDGNAEVNLSGGVQVLSAPDLQRLSAQVAWTLRQIPTVTGIRLLENGTPLTDVGVPRVQPIGLWSGFDPDGGPLATGALMVKAGTVIGERHIVPKALLRPSLSAPVFSAGGAQVAAVRSNAAASTLLVGSALGPARPRLTATAIASPSFDLAGGVLAIAGTGPAATVERVPPTGEAQPVRVPADVLRRGISALSVSRDGARVAMVVGPPGAAALEVGALSAGHGETQISGVTTVIPAYRDVQGVAWANADRIVTTARRSAHRRVVVRTSIDGYRPRVLTSAGLPPRPTQVAAAPGQPPLATAAGAVWSLSGNGWTRLSTGGDPSYAG